MTKKIKTVIYLVIIAVLILSFNLITRLLRPLIILLTSIETVKAIDSGIFFVTGFLLCIAAVLTIKGFVNRTKAKIAVSISQSQQRGKYDAAQQDPFDKLLFEIDKYLTENDSTEFFKEVLNMMKNQLPGIKKQHNDTLKLINSKFSGMANDKYTGKVNTLTESLLTLSHKFIERLEMFDEAGYAGYITDNRHSDIEKVKYQKIYNRYLENGKKVTVFFNETIVALDNAIMELQELDSKELDAMMEELSNINDAVGEIRLY